MFGGFQENYRSADVKPTEIETLDQHPKLEVPSMGDLKSKLEDIFPFRTQECTEAQRNTSENVSVEKTDTGSVILDDGTVVTLPKISDTIPEINSIDIQRNSDVSQYETKPTRELTAEEKDNLKETLGWTDKQISKCTFDEEGVIHYKTDREDMEGKTGENGIKYERKNVNIHGVKIQGVFPVFESLCDVQLPEELEKASNARQFRECNNQLKKNIENNLELRNSFSDEQLEEIEDGDTPSGYVWHHNEETGIMQLVRVDDHDRTQGGAAHTGGKALWGGSYSNHEISTSDIVREVDVTEKSTLNKEVE